MTTISALANRIAECAESPIEYVTDEQLLAQTRVLVDWIAPILRLTDGRDCIARDLAAIVRQRANEILKEQGVRNKPGQGAAAMTRR